MSLVEVLVACGILVVGLLSLAALIPVGLFQAAQAARADAASAVGRAAWRTIKVADLLRPRRADGWGQYYYIHPSSGDPLRGVLPFPKSPMPDVFDPGSPPAFPDYAGAYVIDPYGLSALTGSGNPVAMGRFPAQQSQDAGGTLYLPRVSLAVRMPVGAGGPGWLSGSAARDLCTAFSDATYDYLLAKTDYARPARVVSPVGTAPLSKDTQFKSEGNFSWFVTVSPRFGEPNPKFAVDDSSGGFTGTAGGSIPSYARECTVSVVVVHRRPVPLASSAYQRWEESRANVDMADSDPFGRQIVLRWPAASNLEGIPRLRARDWVLLYASIRPESGNGHLNRTLAMSEDAPYSYMPTASTGLVVAKWCQIQAADAPYVDGADAKQSLSLRASDFETVRGYAGSAAPTYGEANSTVFAATMPNVVGVFEKTTRID